MASITSVASWFTVYGVSAPTLKTSPYAEVVSAATAMMGAMSPM